jgi:hypothetical protein
MQVIRQHVSYLCRVAIQSPSSWSRHCEGHCSYVGTGVAPCFSYSSVPLRAHWRVVRPRLIKHCMGGYHSTSLATIHDCRGPIHPRLHRHICSGSYPDDSAADRHRDACVHSNADRHTPSDSTHCDAHTVADGDQHLGATHVYAHTHSDPTYSDSQAYIDLCTQTINFFLEGCSYHAASRPCARKRRHVWVCRQGNRGASPRVL